MRYVIVQKWVRVQPDGMSPKNRKEFDYHAKFHKWGCDYEEFETGAGNFSTAIVERPNGQIENVPVELIKFVDKN